MKIDLQVVKHEADNDKPAYKVTLRSLFPDVAGKDLKVIVTSKGDSVLAEFPRGKMFTVNLSGSSQKTLEKAET